MNGLRKHGGAGGGLLPLGAPLPYQAVFPLNQRLATQSVGPLSPGSRMRRMSLIGIPPCRTKSL
jgi:hypothetical protein